MYSRHHHYLIQVLPAPPPPGITSTRVKKKRSGNGIGHYIIDILGFFLLHCPCQCCFTYHLMDGFFGLVCTLLQNSSC